MLEVKAPTQEFKAGRSSAHNGQSDRALARPAGLHLPWLANNHDGDVHRRNQNAQTFYVHTRFSEVFLSSLCPSNSSCGSSARWLRGSDAGGRTRPGEQVGSLPPPPGHPEGLRAFSWGPGGGEPQPAAALGVAGAPVSSTAGVSGSSAPRSPNAQPISVAREDPGPRTP